MTLNSAMFHTVIKMGRVFPFIKQHMSQKGGVRMGGGGERNRREKREQKGKGERTEGMKVEKRKGRDRGEEGEGERKEGAFDTLTQYMYRGQDSLMRSSFKYIIVTLFLLILLLFHHTVLLLPLFCLHPSPTQLYNLLPVASGQDSVLHLGHTREPTHRDRAQYRNLYKEEGRRLMYSISYRNTNHAGFDTRWGGGKKHVNNIQE